MHIVRLLECALAKRKTRRPKVDRACGNCGEGFLAKPSDIARGRAKFCSKNCQSEGNRRSVDCSCDQCGTVFVLHASAVARGEGKYCSQRCYGDSKIVDRDGRRLGDIPKSKRQRAEYWGVDYEPYPNRVIFERDNYVCGLCLQVIDSELEYPHPMSASVDHIVPMSRGGDSSPRNVQAAHLECNRSKNNREADQLQHPDRVALLLLLTAAS